MAAPGIVRHHVDGRSNPRSHVGDQASEDPTIAGGVHRGSWRRAHIHHSRAEVVGFVLWWVVIGALTIASVIFIIDQS
jgi:hypothetical protein